MDPNTIQVVPLVGGPMDGIMHELHKGWPAPDRMGLRHPDKPDSEDLHWYKVKLEDGMGYYEYTEKR